MGFRWSPVQIGPARPLVVISTHLPIIWPFLPPPQPPDGCSGARALTCKAIRNKNRFPLRSGSPFQLLCLELDSYADSYAQKLLLMCWLEKPEGRSECGPTTAVSRVQLNEGR